jgi:hypothetical protein
MSPLVIEPMRSNADHTGPDDGDLTVAFGLAGGGAVAFLVGVLLGSRFLRLIGLLAGIGGGALLTAQRLSARQERIDEAQEVISDELAGLDPVARAQVIASLASEATGT